MTIPNDNEDAQKLDHSDIAGGNMVPTLGKSLANFFYNKTCIYHITQQLHTWVCNEMKTYVYAKTCIQMFIAVLFLIAPNWKETFFNQGMVKKIGEHLYQAILF